jgi:hypothetical protein
MPPFTTRRATPPVAEPVFGAKGIESIIIGWLLYRLSI